MTVCQGSGRAGVSKRAEEIVGVSLGHQQLLRVVDALQHTPALQPGTQPRSNRSPGPEGVLLTSPVLVTTCEDVFGAPAAAACGTRSVAEPSYPAWNGALGHLEHRT